MTVLVCGSREWTDRAAIEREFDRLGLSPERDTIVEGEARGADSLSREVAEERGWHPERIKRFPAHWDRYGRSAGPFRNREMLAYILFRRGEGDEVKVLAFTPDLEKSRGTRDMVKLLTDSGFYVEVFNE